MDTIRRANCNPPGAVCTLSVPMFSILHNRLCAALLICAPTSTEHDLLPVCWQHRLDVTVWATKPAGITTDGKYPLCNIYLAARYNITQTTCIRPLAGVCNTFRLQYSLYQNCACPAAIRDTGKFFLVDVGQLIPSPLLGIFVWETKMLITLSLMNKVMTL